mmetsp:Transcript_23946/g.29458  ORF Transcript_23946/g.29458 Transcript_23946/m.29458 type:complete len:576 (+) Transcript_23946:244-1971(+)
MMGLRFPKGALFLALLMSYFGGNFAFTPNGNQLATGSPLSKSTGTANSNGNSQLVQAVGGNDEFGYYSPGVNNIFQNYGEESRQFRRTVYSHEDWVKHRSSNRFFRNLKSTTSSGIYKNLAKEVFATTAVATSVVAWNAIFGEYQDFLSVTHPGPLADTLLPVLALPLAPFTLSSPSLGLLLVFRTNTSYQRWDEARKNWGMNINHTRDLVRMGNAYYDRSATSPERQKEDLERLSLCTWAFVRAMKRHLSPEFEDETEFQKELLEKLPEGQARAIINAAHRPNRALQDLSVAIENMPMNFIRRNEIQRAATIFEDNLGSSERLLSSPVPLFYTRHTARFLSFWLLFLPFALWEPLGNSWNHVDMIPVVSMISIFLFGIEELATQLEEPFTILPMQAFCDKIYNWVTEISVIQPGENGMPIYEQPRPTGLAVPIQSDVAAVQNVNGEIKTEMKPLAETPEIEAFIVNVEAEPELVQAISESGFVMPELDPDTLAEIFNHIHRHHHVHTHVHDHRANEVVTQSRSETKTESRTEYQDGSTPTTFRTQTITESETRIEIELDPDYSASYGASPAQMY